MHGQLLLTLLQLSAFINPWFIFYWIEASGTYGPPLDSTHLKSLPLGFPGLIICTGYTWCFAAQCIICCFGVIPIYLLLHHYGARLRESRPMYMKHVDGLALEGVSQDALDTAASSASRASVDHKIRENSIHEVFA